MIDGLVVDACVACTAGNPKDGTPDQQRRCRDVLLVITQGKSCVLLFSASLYFEWSRHQSDFAVEWLAVMKSRGRVQIVNVPRPQLLRRIIKTAQGRMVRDAIRKDFHLIEAALCSNSPRVISRDNQIRRRFREAAIEVKDIRSVIWSNPDDQKDDTVGWLTSGASPRDDLMLG